MSCFCGIKAIWQLKQDSCIQSDNYSSEIKGKLHNVITHPKEPHDTKLLRETKLPSLWCQSQGKKQSPAGEFPVPAKWGLALNFVEGLLAYEPHQRLTAKLEAVPCKPFLAQAH